MVVGYIINVVETLHVVENSHIKITIQDLHYPGTRKVKIAPTNRKIKWNDYIKITDEGDIYWLPHDGSDWRYLPSLD